MAYQYNSTRKVESETLPGVTFYLRRMTEGRRSALRAKLADHNRRIREIMKAQADLEKTPIEERDTASWMELNDEFESILQEKINPQWVSSFLTKVEGLEVDGKSVNCEDWADFPSHFFQEVLDKIKHEAELGGADEIPNSSLPLISHAQEGGAVRSTAASSAEGKDGTENETAANIIPIM